MLPKISIQFISLNIWDKGVMSILLVLLFQSQSTAEYLQSFSHSAVSITWTLISSQEQEQTINKLCWTLSPSLNLNILTRKEVWTVDYLTGKAQFPEPRLTSLLSSLSTLQSLHGGQSGVLSPLLTDQPLRSPGQTRTSRPHNRKWFSNKFPNCIKKEEQC